MPEFLAIELVVLASAIGLWFENRRPPRTPPEP